MYHSGVTCRNCHEPHGIALRAPGGNAVCAQVTCRPSTTARRTTSHRVGIERCELRRLPHADDHVHDRRSASRPSLRRAASGSVLDARHAERLQQVSRRSRCDWARDQVRHPWYGHDASGYQDYAAALHAGRNGAAQAASALPALVNDSAQAGDRSATALSLLPPYPRSAVDRCRADRAARPRCAGAPRGGRCAAGAAAAGAIAARGAVLTDPIRAVRIEAARELVGVPTDLAGAEVSTQIARGSASSSTRSRSSRKRPEAHTNLCTLFAELGQLEAADAECRKAIRLRRCTPRPM